MDDAEAPAQREDDGQSISFNPSFHPHTGALLFSSNRAGSWAIYSLGRVNTSGTAPVVAAATPVVVLPPFLHDSARYAPDGARLAFVSTREPSLVDNLGSAAVYVLPTPDAPAGQMILTLPLLLYLLLLLLLLLLLSSSLSSSSSSSSSS